MSPLTQRIASTVYRAAYVPGDQCCKATTWLNDLTRLTRQNDTYHAYMRAPLSLGRLETRHSSKESDAGRDTCCSNSQLSRLRSDGTSTAKPSCFYCSILYALCSNSQLPHLWTWREEHGQAVMFLLLHIIRPLQLVTQILFWYRKFLWMFSGLFSFDTMVQRLEIDIIAFRSVPTRILVGTSPWSF